MEEEEAVLRFGQNSKTTGRPNSGPRDPSLPPSFTVAEAGGGREGNNRTGSEREGTVDGRKEGRTFDEFPRTEVSEN